MPALTLDNVTHGYGVGSGRHVVLRDATLCVEENEFVAVMGFSGSGKSTLMALLAGLQVPDEGTTRYRQHDNAPPGPERGIVFQNYSLLPWLTVYGNIELAVRRVFPQLNRHDRCETIERYISLVGLSGSEAKRPAELSGGMRQRLALARTLSMQPDVLLLDEPLSALDALTRAAMQDELIRIWESGRRTVVMVTNDIDEAVLLADRIVPLTRGPGATFGPEFAVDLPRPRLRAELNFDPRFKKIRNAITRYMTSLNPVAHSNLLDVHRIPTITPTHASPIVA
jgi:nitrate/nitrite transport system ATP-binding protein